LSQISPRIAENPPQTRHESRDARNKKPLFRSYFILLCRLAAAAEYKGKSKRTCRHAILMAADFSEALAAVQRIGSIAKVQQSELLRGEVGTKALMSLSAAYVLLLLLVYWWLGPLILRSRDDLESEN